MAGMPQEMLLNVRDVELPNLAPYLLSTSTSEPFCFGRHFLLLENVISTSHRKYSLGRSPPDEGILLVRGTDRSRLDQ